MTATETIDFALPKVQGSLEGNDPQVHQRDQGPGRASGPARRQSELLHLPHV